MIKGNLNDKMRKKNDVENMIAITNGIEEKISSEENETVLEEMVKDIKDKKMKKSKNISIFTKGGRNISRQSTKTEKNNKVIDKREKKVVMKEKKNKVSIINEDDIYRFHCGSNYSAYEMLGSHVVEEDGVKGVRFTTWAPNAKRIFVTGEFNSFYVEEKYQMKRISQYGLWSIFVQDMKVGTMYKYIIETKDGRYIYKSDPYAFASEMRPNNASIIYEPKKFKWEDSSWITKRKRSNNYNSPMNIYEVHLGSWKRKEDGTFLSYDEISKMLPQYVKEMGYTHVELMPLVEHPLDESWGYQATGYYSITSRYGDMEGLKRLINEFHKMNIGVILDWVPGHFCKDAHGLYMFDGTPTYEYQEEWRANNKGWGTYNFDLGRAEVRSFLISNAFFWIEEFHVDGLRVDAVSNMLYLDYGRSHGEWKANKYGDHGNLEGIEFLRLVNKVIREKCKNVIMIAEESTAWPNVCKDEGLGFNFKWNMGWMNDVLEYVQIDTMFRKQHHGKLNFSMMYAYSENFILPISHDEIVHGKKALVEKMFGDDWNKFAGARVFLSYMMGHPGKKLTFMGTELGQRIEWRDYEPLEWYLVEELPMHRGFRDYIKDINKLYLEHKCMWEQDCAPEGFEWIDADDNVNSILSFVRYSKKKDDVLIFVCNFKSEVHYDFKLNVPYAGEYVEILNSDDEKYGGSGQVMKNAKLVTEVEEEEEEKENQHKFNYFINIKVPPMGTTVLVLNKRRKK